MRAERECGKTVNRGNKPQPAREPSGRGIDVPYDLDRDS
jgi:hypothetical protein